MPRMDGEIVACNSLLADVAAFLRSDLNVGSALRLFANNTALGPGMALMQFQEASFPGYARWNLTGVFGNPLKVQDGEYAFTSVPHVYNATGASNCTVYGWYIVKNNKPRYASRLIVPTLMSFPATLSIKVTIEDFAMSIL